MKKNRFVLVGLGRIGIIHLDNLLQIHNVEVVAVMDSQEEALKYARDKGIAIITTTYSELLNINDIDAVIICSPTNTHADYIELAAKKGINIFCEKPLDLSLKRVKEVLQVVEKMNVKLMIGFNRRFDKEFKKIYNVVQNGNIGDHHLVKITSRDPAPPPISYIKTSGGLFLDMTIHDFDMARFIVQKEVDEVYAKGAVLIDPQIGHVGDIDTAVVTLTYTDGTMAVIDNSRKAAYGYDQRLEIFGSKGMVKAENNLQDSHQLYTSQGAYRSLPLHFFLERYVEAYKTEMIDFINSLKNGQIVPTNGNDALQSLKIGLAAIKSINENRVVKLSEII